MKNSFISKLIEGDWYFKMGMRERLKMGNISFSISKLLLCIILLAVSFNYQTAFAEGGGGSGGGKSEPLSLVASTIANGGENVSLKPEIKLTFSKNIVNMKVVDNNKNCFSLATADGIAVPFTLHLADDQIEFEKRNDAVIIPNSELNQGTTYIISISPTLQSKSGVTTGKEIKISFTTEKAEETLTNPEQPKTEAKPETNNNPAPVVAEPEKKEIITPASKIETKQVTEQKTISEQNLQTAAPSDEMSNTDATQELAPRVEDVNRTTEEAVNTESEAVSNEMSNDEEMKGFTPYESAASISANEETEASQSSSSFIMYFILISIIIATAMFFLNKRKNKAK